jgi:hypothetical protein
VALKIGLCGFFGPPVRRQPGKLAYDQRFNIRTRSFFVIRIRADISDVRICQADNLSGITWVGENFLISGEAGIKNGFSAAAGFGARGASGENSPVLKRKCRGLSNLMGQRILLISFGSKHRI